jgi:DNA polymerase-3 subunit epsilon
MKLIYIDTETTGLDINKCAIIQISGYIISDEKEEEFNLLMKPFDGAIITEEALNIQGKNLKEINLYPDQKEIFIKFQSIISKYINKFDKNDKLFFIGYNSRFDSDMIRSWFRRNNDNYYGSWFWHPDIDVMILAASELMNIRNTLSNFKLSTIYKYIFPNDEEFKDESLHDAMFDIKITRKLYEYLKYSESKIIR